MDDCCCYSAQLKVCVPLNSLHCNKMTFDLRRVDECQSVCVCVCSLGVFLCILVGRLAVIVIHL